MNMSRQHFQLIAEVLADTKTEADKLTESTNGKTSYGWKARSAGINELAHEFADRLTETNPNFDRQQFIAVATGERVR